MGCRRVSHLRREEDLASLFRTSHVADRRVVTAQQQQFIEAQVKKLAADTSSVGCSSTSADAPARGLSDLGLPRGMSSAASVGSMSVGVDDASVTSGPAHELASLRHRMWRAPSEDELGEASSVVPAAARSVVSEVVPDEEATPGCMLGGLDVVGEEVASAGASAGSAGAREAMGGHDVDSSASSLHSEGEGEGGSTDGEEGGEADGDDGDAGASVAVRAPRRRRGGRSTPTSPTSGRHAASSASVGMRGGDEEGSEADLGDWDSAHPAGMQDRDDVNPSDHEEEGEDMGASDLKGGTFVSFEDEHTLVDMGAADAPGGSDSPVQSYPPLTRGASLDVPLPLPPPASTPLTSVRTSTGAVIDGDAFSVAGTSVARAGGGSVLWADLMQDEAESAEGGGVDIQAVTEPTPGGHGPSTSMRSLPGSDPGASWHTSTSPAHRSSASHASGRSSASSDDGRTQHTGQTRDPAGLAVPALGEGDASTEGSQHGALPAERADSHAAVGTVADQGIVDPEEHALLGDTPLEAYDETRVLWRNVMNCNASTTAVMEDEGEGGAYSQVGQHTRNAETEPHLASEAARRSPVSPRQQLRSARPMRTPPQPGSSIAQRFALVPSARGGGVLAPPQATTSSPLLAVGSILPPALPASLRAVAPALNIWSQPDEDEGEGDSTSAGGAGRSRDSAPSSASGGAFAPGPRSRPRSAQSAPEVASSLAAAGSKPGSRGRPTSAVSTSRPRPGTARPGTATARPVSATSRRVESARGTASAAPPAMAPGMRPEASSRLQRQRHTQGQDADAAFQADFDAEIPEVQ